MNLTGFYRAFEERFYAPRSVIKQLREQYLPYVSPLALIYPSGETFDIGCGRGEWLELMHALGFQSFGVDLDDGMLQACHELGLNAQQGDAIVRLKTLEDESQVVVSAFHVVEHISFEKLQTLVFEALRVLKPGGLLIMETPNPENIEVATRNFYLDPTHLRPLPPMLLGFLPEFHGFHRVATLRLQESKDIHTRSDIKLIDVLHGVSPDYAIVAQKQAPAEILKRFDIAFSVQAGLDMHSLANRFDRRQDDFLAAHHQTRQGLEAAQGQLKFQENSQNALQIETQALQSKVSEFQDRLALFQIQTDDLSANLLTIRSERDALRNSLSWRITAPIRGLISFVASPVSFTLGKVLQNQNLSTRLNSLLGGFPSLHAYLRRTAIAQGLMQNPVLANASTSVPMSTADLSPRARQIYTKLEQKTAQLKG